jgi:hypothetical protein
MFEFFVFCQEKRDFRIWGRQQSEQFGSATPLGHFIPYRAAEFSSLPVCCIVHAHESLQMFLGGSWYLLDYLR